MFNSTRLLAFTAATMLCSACIERTPLVDELPEWTVNPIPLLDISDDDPDGEVVLGVAAFVTRMPNGGVLVDDRGLHALRFFGANGRFQRAVGRPGSGPGEFEYIRVAYRCGDSLLVEDIVTRRVMLYGLDGTLERTMSTSEFAGGTDAYHSACNADGLFVHHAWGRFDPARRGRQRDPVAVWLTSSAYTRVAELDSVGGVEYVGVGDGATRALLRRTPHLAIGRRHVYVGIADTGVVQVYTLDGTPAGVRTLPNTDLRATPADLERAKRLDTLGQNAAEQAQTRSVWELDTPPSTMPAYDALIVDLDDHLWVRRHPVAGRELTPWIVFNPDGAHVATVALPAIFTVHEIGRDYVAGIVLDPDTGRHAVRVAALGRSPAP